jgi:hypothetical protein
MDSILQFIAVFALGILEIWIAIPVGFISDLNPVFTLIAASLGAVSGVLLAFLLMEELISWVHKRIGINISDYVKERRLYRIWKKYGVIGLGLFAPLTGVVLPVAIGLVSDIPKRPLFIWIVAGIVLWSALLALAIFLGITAVESFTG